MSTFMAVKIKGTAKQLSRMEAFRKKLAERSQKEIENLAAYTAKSLHNAPKKVPESQKNPRKGAYYEEMTLRIYFPNPNGGLEDSGMTVAEYLKKIKGGFRATGHRTFEKEKVQTRAKGSRPPGTYKYENQRPGEFFTKGTGFFGEEEHARLENIRKKRRKLNRDLRKRNSEATAKVRMQIRSLERSAKRAAIRGAKLDQKRARKLTKLQESVVKKRQKLLFQRDQKLAKFEEKHRAYRIVQRGNSVVDPQKTGFLRIGARAGQVPRSWSGGGLRNYYIRKNWEVNITKGAIIKLDPFPGGRDSTVLQKLECGGIIESSPVLMGYSVFIEDESSGGAKFSHRRILFYPVYSYEAPINEPTRHLTMRPRPFVAPTLERIRERKAKALKKE